MKQILVVAFCLISLSAFSQDATEVKEGINWMTWEEAYNANKKQPKKIFIDIYTDWCGWCKKMDKSTFMDAEVIKTINDHFYAVKFNAEQKNEIEFNGAKFKLTSQGRNGTHQLAYALLDGRMGYPAFVTLDEQFHRIVKSPGFKKPKELIRELKYVHTESYKKVNLTDFGN